MEESSLIITYWLELCGAQEKVFKHSWTHSVHYFLYTPPLMIDLRRRHSQFNFTQSEQLESINHSGLFVAIKRSYLFSRQSSTYVQKEHHYNNIKRSRIVRQLLNNKHILSGLSEFEVLWYCFRWISLWVYQLPPWVTRILSFQYRSLRSIFNRVMLRSILMPPRLFQPLTQSSSDVAKFQQSDIHSAVEYQFYY